ncbi:MAG: TolC family protein, partial [Verrucomicrobiota bacterium]
YRFFLKPCNAIDLLFTIERALEHKLLEEHSRALLRQFRKQAAVLNALQEVSDALISREKLADARTEQRLAVAAYKEAVKVAIERYRQGDSSYYEVLQEQQDLFPTEDSLVQTQLNQLLAVVQLYSALGGGWEMEKTGGK